MINRNEIIELLKKFSYNKEYVYAMWLEGADGINKIDEYSDIDFWFDVDDNKKVEFLFECINELEKLGEIDSRVDEIRDDIAQSNVHLKNTSEYLTLDICVQKDSRKRSTTCFVENDIAELPLVLFDKKNVITFTEKIEPDVNEIKKIFLNNKNRIMQMSRVKKYICRNQYMEAYMKYIENIAYPLVEIARLIYTPRHYSYGLCHINDHLPSEIVSELEKLFRINNFDDINNNLNNAIDILEKFEKKIKEKYLI